MKVQNVENKTLLFRGVPRVLQLSDDQGGTTTKASIGVSGEGRKPRWGGALGEVSSGPTVFCFLTCWGTLYTH